MSVDRRRQLIEPDHRRLSIARQCALVSISRSSFYYAPTPADEATLELMRVIDEAFLEMPWYGDGSATTMPAGPTRRWPGGPRTRRMQRTPKRGSRIGNWRHEKDPGLA